MSRYSQSARTIGLALLSASLLAATSCGDEDHDDEHQGHEEEGHSHLALGAQDHTTHVQALPPAKWPESVTFNKRGARRATKLSELVIGNRNKTVTIPEGMVAYIDQNIGAVKKLVVKGELHCDTADTEDDPRFLVLETMEVTGLFQCGTPTDRYKGKLTIKLKHSTNLDPKQNHNYRALIAHMGGQLNLFGDTSRAGVRRLAKTEAINSDQLTLVGDLMNTWRPGDEIGIAPSSFDGTQHESAKINSMRKVGKNTRLFLDRRLEHQHLGIADTFETKRNGDIPFNHRTEVVNLTRHIVITSHGADLLDDDSEQGQRGGHVMIHHGGYAFIKGVEFSKLGQAGIMGRYPFHWHKQGDSPNQYVEGSVVHHSFQRCFVIHQTNKVKLHNNSCFDFRGHGFFLEDGNEIRNVLTNNIAIGSRFPSPSKLLLDSDNPNATPRLNRERFAPVSNFWIANPNNKIQGNIAAGGVGTGFWNSFVRVVKEFREFNEEGKEINSFSGAELARPSTTDTWVFKNNTAHSTLLGFTWDGAFRLGNGHSTNNPNNPMDRKISITHYNPPTTPTFQNLTAFKNVVGMYFRGNTAIFDKALFVNNHLSIFVAYNQVFKNTVVADKLNKHDKAYNVDDDTYLYDTTPGNLGLNNSPSGIRLYDGPWELNNVDFINFDDVGPRRLTIKDKDGKKKKIRSSPFMWVGGARKLTNISQKLSFTPDPQKMFFNDSVRQVATTSHAHTIRDLDGTLSGERGALLISDVAINEVDGQCIRDGKFGNMLICEGYDSNGVFYLEPNGDPPEVEEDGEEVAKKSGLDFIVRRVDRDERNRTSNIYSPARELWENIAKETKRKQFVYINTPQVDRYEVLLLDPPDDFNLTVSTEHVNNAADKLPPILPLRGLTKACEVFDYTDGVKNTTPLKEFSTINQLRRADGSGYYQKDGVLHIKTKPKTYTKTTPGPKAEANVGMQFLNVKCAGKPMHQIKYDVSYRALADGSIVVSGWMCNYGLADSLRGEIYLGSKKVGSTRTKIESEEGLSFACGNITGKHRFSYTIPKNTVNSNPGAVKLKIQSATSLATDRTISVKKSTR